MEMSRAPESHHTAVQTSSTYAAIVKIFRHTYSVTKEVGFWE